MTVVRSSNKLNLQLRELDIPQEVVQTVSAKYATHYKIMPFEIKGDILSIASTDPNDVQLIDEISLVVGMHVKPVRVDEKEISEAIRKYYGVGAETIDEMMSQNESVLDANSYVDDIDDITSEASISKFLNEILVEAYQQRATDIHIEPFKDELQVRYRVDGILYDAQVPPNLKHFKDAINSRIKILSNLNIAEKRLPQDGRFKLQVDDYHLDMRVSFMPVPNGESVVLRLLNSARLYDLDELGFSDEEHKLIHEMIYKPHGIIFLTGPTGSGKSTTLYSCLAHINSKERKIITIEDPIEYQLKGITQIQVNPPIDFTFAKGLRSMLRHDPDVMMVGEVRDRETAEIAIQIALTGHLIFSTLHTNDAATGVTRLLDMGIEPFLITSTVECFIAQRLVRTNCEHCKEQISLSEQQFETFSKEVDVKPDMKIYQGRGCKACHKTGYSGRKAIYEFLPLTEQLNQLIVNRATASEIRECAVKSGMRTLRYSGWELVKQGLSTPEEVLRVTV